MTQIMNPVRPSAKPEDWVGRILDVVVDRPLGSRHPGWPEMIYPVNYGFVPGTKAHDGAEVDVYILGPDRPLRKFRGRCIAILHRADDNEDKLVVAPVGAAYSDEEILGQVAFQERYFKTTLLR